MEFDLTGIPRGQAVEEPLKLEGIPKDEGLNLDGIPKLNGDIEFKNAELKSLPDNYEMPKPTEQDKQMDFDFYVNKLAEKIFTAHTGLTPQQGEQGKKDLQNVMARAPLVGTAFMSPLLSLGVEALSQVKNAVVSGIEKKKYNPLEQRLLTELLPKDLPTAVKVGANVGEVLTDVALLGGLSNLAKKGMLEDTIKTLGGKLEKAGYGTGKVTVNRDALKEVVKGSTLETEAKRWLKAKTIEINPKFSLEDIPKPTKNLPALSEDVAHQNYLKQVELNATDAHLKFTNDLGGYLSNEKGTVNLPDMPIRENINAFKEALGKEFVRGYGLTPEAKLAFTKLRESEEVTEMETIDFLKKNIQVSDDDAKLLTYHLENPNKYPIPDNLKPQADIARQTFDRVYQELEKRNMLGEKFPQTFINRINEDIVKKEELIKTLNDEKTIQAHKEDISDLKEKAKYLEDLHYVPHQYKPLIESQVIKLFSTGKLSSRPTKIIGRMIETLDDAKLQGLIPVEDIRVLMGSYMNYAKNKIAIHDFIEGFKGNENIVMPELKAPEDWKKVTISQLDGYKVHPYLADALKNYVTPYQDPGLLLGTYDKLNKTAKTLLFYNFFVMSLNNLQQTYLAGFNHKLPKYLWESVRDLTQKTDFYKDAIRSGLFSSPYKTNPRIEDQVQMWIDEAGKKNTLVKGFVHLANPVSLYGEINKVTWNLDRIMRMATLKNYLAHGMPYQKAIDKTNLFYVDYSFIPDHLRRNLNRVFLTPTYRLGIARLYINLHRHPVENAGALGRLYGFWIGTGLFTAWAGWKIENNYRLVRKLKEPIVTKDGKVLEEQVFALPSPLFEYQKISGRAFSKNLYMNLARVPYIAFSLAKNKDWKGDPIVDRAMPLDDRARQMIYYIIKTYVAPIEGFDNLTSEDQTAIEKILNALAIGVYKRQDSTKYLINQVESTLSDHRDYLRRHPEASDEDIRKVQIETEKRINNLLKEISDHEKN